MTTEAAARADLMLDQQLKRPDYSTWNHTSLWHAVEMAAGYTPFDDGVLLPAATRTKAMTVLARYLTGAHYFNLIPKAFLTSYGAEFQKIRRVAFRVLEFSKANPQFAIPQATTAAWAAAEGLT
jgi:hypothetical protein